MELLDFYPPPSDLIGSELKVLAYLQNNTIISEVHERFAADAKRYYDRGRNVGTCFEFCSYLDLWHAQAYWKRSPRVRPRGSRLNIRLFICAKIELAKDSYRNVSYCLSVCRIKSLDPSCLSILRKFHFDIAVANDERKQRQEH